MRGMPERMTVNYFSRVEILVGSVPTKVFVMTYCSTDSRRAEFFTFHKYLLIIIHEMFHHFGFKNKT